MAVQGIVSRRQGMLWSASSSRKKCPASGKLVLQLDYTGKFLNNFLNEGFGMIKMFGKGMSKQAMKSVRDIFPQENICVHMACQIIVLVR